MHKKLLEDAKKTLNTADHLLNVSYPLIKDEKMFIAILDNLFLTASNTIGALLYYLRKQKKIPKYNQTFDSKINTMKLNVSRQYNLPYEKYAFTEEMKQLVKIHKEAPTEFPKNNNYVFTDAVYKTEKITEKKLQSFLTQTKNLIDFVEEKTK